MLPVASRKAPFTGAGMEWILTCGVSAFSAASLEPSGSNRGYCQDPSPHPHPAQASPGPGDIPQEHDCWDNCIVSVRAIKISVLTAFKKNPLRFNDLMKA